ncbi:hypothetical protein R6Q59_017798 [Mikania micrantha]|uniref:Uncharacterized protein n=1 Tax=Mikania micrantha TaxID=192012 RepID=A0A5N6PU46_9ASTR|nr:hypothetical protein E3N88_07516 [Mikania micrantha]
MPLPPWRRADYVKAKWISPCNPDNNNHQSFSEITIKSNPVSDQKDPILIAEFEATDEERLEEAVKQWEPLKIRPKVPKSGDSNGVAFVLIFLMKKYVTLNLFS